MDLQPEIRHERNGRGSFLATCAVLAIVYFGFSFVFNALADPPTSPYTPGETLSPTCAPTSTNCTVQPPLFSTTTLPIGGILFTNDASGTVTANTSSLYWNPTTSIFLIGGPNTGGTPAQNGSSSLLQLGANAVSGGNVSGTFIGSNVPTGYAGDFLNFEINSSSILQVDGSGTIEIATGTAAAGNALLTIATATNILSVLNNGNIGIGTSSPAASLQIGQNIGLINGTNTLFQFMNNSFYTGNPTGTGNIYSNYVSSTFAFNNTTSTITNYFANYTGGRFSTGTISNWYSYYADKPLATGTISNLWAFFVPTGGGSTQLQTTTVISQLSLGISSSSEGLLQLFNSNTNFSLTLREATATTGNVTLTLPSSTGAAGQSLVTDGSGNLSWGSTGFTVIASTTTNLTLTTNLASDTTAGITPSNSASQVWITGVVQASTTAATSTITLGIFKTSACATQVGSVVTSTLQAATTSAAEVLTISINAVDAPASTVKQNYFLCAKAAVANASITSGRITLQEIRAGSDLAEVYYAASNTSLTAGDVVSADPSIDAGVMQSQIPYDNTLLGIISTQPGAVLGNTASSSGVQELVALAGRVPVHVTNENGNINVGDELTSSDIPGVAMRATQPGKIVGIALEAFSPDPSEGTTTGSVLTFVNPGWSFGNLTSTAEIASSSWALEGTSSTQYILDQFTAYVQAALAKLGLAIQNGIATLQEVIANKVTTNELCVQGTCINGADLQNVLNANNISGQPTQNDTSTIIGTTTIEENTSTTDTSDPTSTDEIVQPTSTPDVSSGTDTSPASTTTTDTSSSTDPGIGDGP